MLLVFLVHSPNPCRQEFLGFSTFVILLDSGLVVLHYRPQKSNLRSDKKSHRQNEHVIRTVKK
jgi:hypothetical protein